MTLSDSVINEAELPQDAASESEAAKPRTAAERSRENGRKSRGPVTPEGKAVSRLNAIKHGAYAMVAIIDAADEPFYHQALEELRAEWEPVGQREDTLVLQLRDAKWRHARTLALEFNMHTAGRLDLEREYSQYDDQPLVRRVLAECANLRVNRALFAQFGRDAYRAERSILLIKQELLECREERRRLQSALDAERAAELEAQAILMADIAREAAAKEGEVLPADATTRDEQERVLELPSVDRDINCYANIRVDLELDYLGISETADKKKRTQIYFYPAVHRDIQTFIKRRTGFQNVA